MRRVAIIGCGGIAGGYDEQSDENVCQTHAKACLLTAGLSLVAVCDRDGEKARTFAARWNAGSAYEDVREMLASARPEIVVISSPTATHVEMLERCLAQPGVRAVLCEKPAGFDPGELAPLLPRFAAAGILFAVNYSRAHAPGIQQFRARLEELGGCIEAVVDYGKGIFSYGSHAIQWFADWLGEISNVRVGALRAGSAEGDPSVDASFLAGGTAVRLRGTAEDCFNVEFRCRDGAIRFFNYACECAVGSGVVRTGLETVMWDVHADLVARLDGVPSRLVEGAEALAVLEVCAALAKGFSK